ncbi:MAG: hypothetical protein OXI84_10210 [bacterium]|nr:hypothetical protein [bacterium]
MSLRAGAARSWRPGMLALVAAMMALGPACSTSSNEVVFEGSPSTEATTAAAAEDGAATTTATTAPAATGTGATTVSAADTTTMPAAPERSAQGMEALTAPVLVDGRFGGGITVVGPGAERNALYVERADGFLAQPIWSPDGQLVAFSRASTTESWLVIGPGSGGTLAAYETPFVVFYIHWSPDGRFVAMLGSADSRVALAILDLDTGTVKRADSAVSYYFHWSPDSTRMLAHLDNSRLQILDLSSGEITRIAAFDFVWSAYQAPSWMPDGRSILYVRPAGDQSEEPPDELVIHDLVSGRIEVLATGAGFFAFAVSPDGARVAYSLHNLNYSTSMYLVEPGTGQVAELDAPNTVAWQWSPDSRKILLLGISEERQLSMDVYQDGSITSYPGIAPTENFLRSYIPFWNQYGHSHTLWAPDSSAFVYAASDQGDDYVFLQPLEEERPLRLGAGSMAVFAPRN